MTNQTVQLIEAKTKDISLIAELAKEIWMKHYVPIIGIEQVEYMLNMMYSDDSLLEQMTKKSNQFYLIQANEQPIGFISVSKVPNQDNNYFIHKYYILPDQASQGIGTKSFKVLLEILQPQQLQLTVNRHNFKSINFYFKNGFTIESVADFDIGNGYVMNDFVMQWTQK